MHPKSSGTSPKGLVGKETSPFSGSCLIEGFICPCWSKANYEYRKHPKCTCNHAYPAFNSVCNPYTWTSKWRIQLTGQLGGLQQALIKRSFLVDSSYETLLQRQTKHSKYKRILSFYIGKRGSTVLGKYPFP